MAVGQCRWKAYLPGGKAGVRPGQTVAKDCHPKCTDAEPSQPGRAIPASSRGYGGSLDLQSLYFVALPGFLLAATVPLFRVDFLWVSRSRFRIDGQIQCIPSVFSVSMNSNSYRMYSVVLRTCSCSVLQEAVSTQWVCLLRTPYIHSDIRRRGSSRAASFLPSLLFSSTLPFLSALDMVSNPDTKLCSSSAPAPVSFSRQHPFCMSINAMFLVSS